MVSFFRRKKPGSAPSERRYSTEELAAAFPGAQPERTGTTPTPDAGVDVSATKVVDRAEVALKETAAPAASDDPETHAQPIDEHVETARSPTPSPLADDVLPAAEPVREPVAPEVAPFTVSTPRDKPTAPERSGWRDRLRGTAFARTFGGLFQGNPRLDDDLLDEIETALIIADVGVTATTDLVEDLRKRMKSREFADASALLHALRQDLIELLEPVAVPLRIDAAAKPFVILTVGVNGVGKTTTIGKLARRFKDEGHSLMLAAGDTFRAAAVAQLQTWGERNGVPVIAQGQNADAASVAFDALQAAKARGTQVLIADTAGRLHTQQGLMAELGKIKRVLQKLDTDAPHEVLMVIDGTTGQNALSQLRQFHAAVQVTGLVVTKLDGTAKGGVVFALAREFGIPIRFAGIGEKLEDLRVFDAGAFVDALLPDELGA